LICVSRFSSIEELVFDELVELVDEVVVDETFTLSPFPKLT
jgi:hypothetical protein